MLIYTKLWLLLEKRGMKRTDLKEIMSSATLAKLGKNEPVSSTVIAKICDFLNCQPNDIMENVTKENIEKASGELNEKVNEMLNLLTLTTGMSKEAILDNFVKELPDFIDTLKKDNINLFSDYVKKPKE
jgi:putative transcriptional regulator